MLTNGLNMNLPLGAKNTVHEVKTHGLSGKETVTDEAVSKEGHADSLLGYEMT